MLRFRDRIGTCFQVQAVRPTQLGPKSKVTPSPGPYFLLLLKHQTMDEAHEANDICAVPPSKSYRIPFLHVFFSFPTW
jgi:hypothetical protein